MAVGDQLNSRFFTQRTGQSYAPYPYRPHHGHPPQNQRIPFLCVTNHSSGHTEEWESLTPTRGARQGLGKLCPAHLAHAQRANVLSMCSMTTHSSPCSYRSQHSSTPTNKENQKSRFGDMSLQFAGHGVCAQATGYFATLVCVSPRNQGHAPFLGHFHPLTYKRGSSSGSSVQSMI